VLTFADVPCFILAMSDARKELLGNLFKAAARSFYLTLRRQIGSQFHRS
jgi:hypothetical protein